ncbi:F-box protein [Canna indica]|uniref:F-box protein n=1 Tax=Canna indica TaxID=4628 RepID=A0AAQ3JXX0_9LILI|nr:F-box protein [Canna indica]
MADWSNVPKDLLLKIFSTSEIPDILRTAAVCVSWSDAVHELRCSRRHLCNQSPWLMFSADDREDNPSAARFYSLSEQKTYTIPLPESSIRDRLCVGSSHGWLITADQTSELQLLNPITGAQIDLTSILTYDHIEPIRNERGRLTSYIVDTLEVVDRSPDYPPPEYKLDKLRLCMYFKVILSSDPSRGDYTVVVIHNPYRRISFVRAGDNKWTALTSDYMYDDVVFHRGQLYASAAGQMFLVVLDLASPIESPGWWCRRSRLRGSTVARTWWRLPVVTTSYWRYDIGVFSYEDLSISRILPSEAPPVSWPPPIWFMPSLDRAW